MDGSNPTPLSAVLDWAGQINQNDYVINLSYNLINGVNGGWNLIGNPYLSNLNMQNLSIGSSIQNTYAIWNTNLGTKGQYQSFSFSDLNVLPIGGAFFAKANGIIFNSITITESNKTTMSATTGLLKSGKKAGESLEFELWSNDTILWDILQLKQIAESEDLLDRMDAQKMTNPDVNFYSLAPSADKLAIDCRPNLSKAKSIWLGIQTSPYHFTLKLKQHSLLGTKVYLIDHFKNLKQEVKPNWKYEVEVTSDSASFGEKRFELVFEDVVNSTEELAQLNSIKVYPNPSQGSTIYLMGEPSMKEGMEYAIYDVAGTLLSNGNYQAKEGIPTNGLKDGVHVIQLKYKENFNYLKFVKIN